MKIRIATENWQWIDVIKNQDEMGRFNVAMFDDRLIFLALKQLGTEKKNGKALKNWEQTSPSLNLHSQLS